MGPRRPALADAFWNFKEASEKLDDNAGTTPSVASTTTTLAAASAPATPTTPAATAATTATLKSKSEQKNAADRSNNKYQRNCQVKKQFLLLALFSSLYFSTFACFFTVFYSFV